MTTVAREAIPAEADAVPSETTSTSRKPFVIGLILLAGAIGGTGWYLSTRGRESTDDAQVDGEVVAVPARMAGIVSKIHFAENQHVKAGDLLAELEDAPVKARLAQAEAALVAAQASADAADAEAVVAEANAVGNKSVAAAGLQTASVGVTSYADQIREGEAQLQTAQIGMTQATSDHERAKTLFASGSIAKAEFDRSETAFSVAESNVAAAQARLGMLREAANQAKSRVAEASARFKQSSFVEPLVKQAQARAAAAHASVDTARALRDLAAIDVSYTKIYAPHEGIVSKKTINEGQAIGSGQAIVQVVTNHTWVTANFKETQLGRMRTGQPAHFSVDAYPGVEFAGDVESISGATGARFTLLAPDNATGNFTKIVQRIPVRVHVHDAPAGIVLRPGMSVELTVDTR